MEDEIKTRQRSSTAQASEIELTRTEMEKLYRIELLADRILLHGMSGSFAMGGNFPRYIQTEYATQAAYSETLAKGLHVLSTAWDRLGGYLEVLRKKCNSKFDDVFITDMAEFLCAVESSHPSHLHVTGPSSDHLQLIYPPSALYAIIDEIITNGFCHGGTEVTLSWDLRGLRLVCVIEDNGQGISDRLLDSYLPVYECLPDRSGEYHGLDMVHSIVRRSEGIFLMSRAPSSQGTRILIELPLLGIRQNGVLRRDSEHS